MSGWTQGDLTPPLSGTVIGKVRSNYPTLTDAEFDALPLVPVDLTPASTVDAWVERSDGTTFAHTATPAVDQTAHKGQWSMPLQPGDLTDHGNYSLQILVMWPGNVPQRFGLVMFHVARKIT